MEASLFVYNMLKFRMFSTSLELRKLEELK